MFRIPRPKEPGVFNLELLEGDTIEGITFSNMEHESFNIHTSSGKIFVVFISDGALSAAVLDLAIPQNHRGH